MSFSFSSLVRLLVLMALGATTLAVGVSRLDPPRPARRTTQHANYMNINEYFLDVADRTPRWLDVESGRVKAQPLSDGDILEAATCSPWVDERGRRQVVGRWTSRTTDGPMSMSKDFGLARYTFPDGEMLDQVSTEIVPIGPPCWFPGSRARVVFAAGDGMLYHFAFEPDPSLGKPADSEPGHDPRPRPVAWRVHKPAHDAVFMADLTWPEDPRMSDFPLVSLRAQVPGPGGSPAFSRTQLWWIKLNHAGTEIVEAAPLLMTDRSDFEAANESDVRTPTVGTLPDGSLAVAYLRQHVDGKGWDLRIAPIRFDGERHTPRAMESESRLLRDRCQPASPAFSTDGRWISAITGLMAFERRIARIPIADALPTPPAR